jgi:hypothetical protein
MKYSWATGLFQQDLFKTRENKSYHQIAKEARICPRDIKAILEKPVKAMELKESMMFCCSHLMIIIA